MHKDIKDINFSSLINDYREVLAIKKEEALDTAVTVARLKYNRKFNDIKSQLLAEDREDGFEEIDREIVEQIGAFDESLVAPDSETIDKVSAAARVSVVEEFCKTYNIGLCHSWLPYQLIAYFGSWTPVKDGDKYSFKKTIAPYLSDDNAMGLLMFATSPRGPMFEEAPKQYRQYNSPIGPMIPIVLAGFKQHKNIKYMDWDHEYLEFAVHKELHEAMMCEAPELTITERLELRNTAITNGGTGPRAGKRDDPSTSYRTNGLGSTAIGHLPKLGKHWVIQTWCAHPVNYNKLGIYDSKDWDAKPVPLIENELVNPVKTSAIKWSASKPTYTSDTPW